MKECYCLNPVLPKKVMIELSNICNHRCIFCANPFSKRERGLIDDDLAKRIICKLKDWEISELSFHGMGEPFTNPKLAEYIKLAKDNGIDYVYIDTNCGLATPDKVDRVVEAGLDSIKISLSAADRGTFKRVQGRDDFDNVVSNLDYIVSLKDRHPNLKVYIDFVSLTLNEGQEKVLMDKYGKKVNDFWVSDLLNQAGNMAGKIEQYMLREPEVGMCEEPFNRLNITKDGLVSACCMDNDDNLILGDLSKNTIEEIWHSERAVAIRKAMLTGNNMPKQCALCDMRKVYSIKEMVFE